MALKEVTLTLIDFRKFPHHYEINQHFRVEKIKNSIDWLAGEWLTEVVVQDLISQRQTVVITRMAKNSDFAYKQ